MSEYAASNEVLVFLINQTVNGSPQQRLAAKFILDCLRAFDTSDEIEHCIDELERHAIAGYCRGRSVDGEQPGIDPIASTGFKGGA